jgi:hypothetical protein
MLYWCSVDALLMLCICSVEALCMLCWCSVYALLTLCWRSLSGEAILTFSILPIPAAYTLIMDNSRSAASGEYKMQTQSRWRCFDAHFQTAAVTTLRALLPTKGANTLIMGKCRSTALESYKMQHPRLLMLCWRSVDALLMLCWRSGDGLLTRYWRSLLRQETSTLTRLLIQVANTLIMDTCHSTAPRWYMMKHTKSLTLCWHSFSDWGCDNVDLSFAHKGCHNVDSG